MVVIDSDQSRRQGVAADTPPGEPVDTHAPPQSRHHDVPDRTPPGEPIDTHAGPRSHRHGVAVPTPLYMPIDMHTAPRCHHHHAVGNVHDLSASVPPSLLHAVRFFFIPG